MTMQTDVKAGHLNSSGAIYTGRARVKAITSVASGTAGTVNIWDTLAAPVAATYARAGNTITVTLAAHGFAVGQTVGISFAAASGVSATSGNYVIQSSGFTSGAFTLIDINSGTIAAGTGCTVTGTGFFLTSFDTPGTSSMTNTLLPGEGMLARSGIYVTMSNQTGITIYYG